MVWVVIVRDILWGTLAAAAAAAVEVMTGWKVERGAAAAALVGEGVEGGSCGAFVQVAPSVAA